MAPLKSAKQLRGRKKVNQPDTSRPPNRTSDEAAMTEETARRTDIRDPLRASGQLPPYARRKTHLDADENYGNTEIPHRKEGQTGRTKAERVIKRVQSAGARKPSAQSDDTETGGE